MRTGHVFKKTNLHFKDLWLRNLNKVSEFAVSEVSLATQDHILAPYEEHAPVDIPILISHVDPLHGLGEE